MVLLAAFKSADQVPIPNGWPHPTQKTLLNRNQIQLGRTLFYDPHMSANNLVSCASCHSPYNAFAHTDHALSHGIDDRIGKRNAPTLMNLAWRKDFMWDGAFNNLEEQVAFPIDHPDEMGSALDSLPLKLDADKYGQMFAQAFGDSSITPSRITKSISSFLLSLVSYQSKYDEVKKGLKNFSEQENNGYYIYKNHCASCHQEPLFTSGAYAFNDLEVDEKLKDYGRMQVTRNSRDSLRFRIPSLRNIEYTYPYMHDGRFKNMWEVLHHYNQADSLSDSKGRKVKNIRLNAEEKVDLMAFLLTLTDKKFLFNPAHAYPKSNSAIQLSKTENTY